MKNFLPFVTATALLLLFSFQAQAQGYTLEGTQIKGTAGNNASLQCQGLTITKTVKITDISGNNAGFWIQSNGALIKNFWKKNDSSGIGFTLKPGTYFVYPNLAPNQNQASVKLTLQ